MNAKLCLLFALICFTDGALTLFGQSEEYLWGNYEAARDHFIPVVYLLEQNPILFLIVGIIWITMWCLIIISLSRFWAQVLSLALISGHTRGALSWAEPIWESSHTTIYFVVIPIISFLFILCTTDRK